MNYYVNELKTEYTFQPIGLDQKKPRLSWKVNSSENNLYQSAYQILVATRVDLLEKDRADIWDSGKVISNETIHIEYEGKSLIPDTKYYWTVRVWNQNDAVTDYCEPAYWQTGLMVSENWKANWISPTTNEDENETNTAPIMRKEFTITKEIKQATVFVHGFGWYELHFNGNKASDRFLAPSSSPSNDLLYYDTYDVTDYIQHDQNTIGLWIGDGYNSNYNKYGWHWDGPKRAIVQLHIKYTDENEEYILSDRTWKYSKESPILFNHIYDGETYDARQEKFGWDMNSYDDSSWLFVRELSYPTNTLKSSIVPGIKVMKTIKPVNIYNPKPDIYTIDMGQNFAGWCKLHVQGEAGTKIILRHSENILETGEIDPWTNRAAKSTDTYILKGTEDEIYEPRFTYHGFRYVEISGFPGVPTLDHIEGRVAYSALEQNGHFQCSNDLINQIQKNICWGMTSNFMSFPTDCPNRDERTPCLMDSAVYEETAICNLDMHQYYTNWLLETLNGRNTPDWAGDNISLSWHLYQYYMDIKILKDNYDALKSYMDYCNTQATDYIFDKTFGDWCAPNIDNDYLNSFSSISETNTALYYYHLTIMAEIATLLDKNEDAEQYKYVAQKVADAYHCKFYDTNVKCYSGGKQTPNILALAFGMVKNQEKENIITGLINNIQEKNGHLDTGIYGTRFLLDVLADHGYIDTAYEILNKITYPSFGYTIAQGATTLWEQWGNGVGKWGMQSHNHAMFSGIGVSFYTKLAGIKSVANTYKKILIEPIIPNGLNHVDARLDTVRGKISVNWIIENGNFILKVIIPTNCSAEIILPSSNIESLKLNGTQMQLYTDKQFKVLTNNKISVPIGNGSFTLSVTL